MRQLPLLALGKFCREMGVLGPPQSLDVDFPESLRLGREYCEAYLSAPQRGCSPQNSLAGENQQSSNQQRTFPPETSRHPSAASPT